MIETQDRAYWLFQAHPKKVELVEALRANALHSFWVKAHKDKIHAGDKVILWQTGKQSGVYALGTVRSEPLETRLSDEESKYWKHHNLTPACHRYPHLQWRTGLQLSCLLC